MITFKEFLLEYAKGDNAVYFGAATVKYGFNGKSYDRAFDRKNFNTVKKEYKHKHPIISSIIKGNANNVVIGGAKLRQILNMYQIENKPGKKTLGNSGVSIEIFVDQQGNQKGILRRRKTHNQNGMQPN